MNRYIKKHVSFCNVITIDAREVVVRGRFYIVPLQANFKKLFYIMYHHPPHGLPPSLESCRNIWTYPPGILTKLSTAYPHEFSTEKELEE
jgi:hypothetical protein